MLTPAQRRALLDLARASVTARVTGTAPPAPDSADLPDVQAAAFVSLHRRGDLRGCIGSLERDEALADVVARCAASAATEDPRFPPVIPAELPAMDLEISVLGPLERIDPVDPAAVEIGRHGLVVEQGGRRGLLLPQVAVEWGWDRETFLAHACRKAGLPADAWRTGAVAYRFEALVFGEAETASPPA